MSPRNEQVQRVISDSRLLWEAGQEDEALALLREATTEMPDEPDVWLELGGDLTYMEPGEASEAVERATDLADGDPDTLTRCAWAMFHLEDYSRARDLLLRAHEADPDGDFAMAIDAFHLAGKLASEAGDARLAEEQFAFIVNTDPDDAGFAQSLIRLLIGQGRLDEASVALERALEHSPSDPRLGAARVDLLVRQLAGGRVRDAEDAPRSEDPELESLVERSNDLCEAGSATDNAALLDYATETFPGEVEIVTRAAAAQADLGNTEVAHRRVQEALALGPRDPWNLTNLADLLSALDALEAAEAVMTDAAIYAPVGWERAPDIIEVAANLAIARGDAEAAEKYLRAALAAVPDNGHAALKLAELHAAADRRGDAAEVLRRVLAAGADDERVRQRLGELEAG